MQFADTTAPVAAQGHQDFQRAASTKRLKTPDAYTAGGILKKSNSTPDLAGLTLGAQGGAVPRAETVKVQFDEATLTKLAAERAIDKINRPSPRKGLKRSAQSCPDLASLAEEESEEYEERGKLSGFHEDLVEAGHLVAAACSPIEE